jgi:hypothetical protein
MNQAVLDLESPPSAATTARANGPWPAPRLQATRRGAADGARGVDVGELTRPPLPCCPVLRVPLVGAGGRPDAAVVERIDPEAGRAAGNLAVMSLQAAQAWRGVDLAGALQRVHACQGGAGPVAGLDAPAWWRLAALRSFATPLAFEDALRLPLALLPPAPVVPVNAVQRLQAALTMIFTAPGWSGRCRMLAAWLPEPTLRQAFHLFVGALAPRVLEAGPEPGQLLQALEDAWLLERVQRRWQGLALCLGPAATERWLDRCAATPGTAGRIRRDGAPLAGGGAQGRARLRPCRGREEPAARVLHTGRPGTRAEPWAV